MEGFPHNPNDVQYMLQRHLFPDIVVIMAVDVTDVQKRLLPTYLESWRERRHRRETQLNLLHDLRKKNRVSKWWLGRIIFLPTLLSCIGPPDNVYILFEYLAQS